MKWLSILFVCFQLTLIAQPPDPAAPPPAPRPNLLPIVLVNNTTLPDNQVHIVILGRNPANSGPQGVIQFLQNPSGQLTGVTELIQVPTTGNTSTYSVTLSQLPSAPNTPNGRYFYVPAIESGIIFFSLAFSNDPQDPNYKFNQPLNMPINGGAVQQPNFTDPADPNGNYNTIFDIFEFTFLPSSAGTNISANATAVSFFSIPLYGFLSGANTAHSNTGLFLPRNSILASAQNFFANAPEAAQWNQLVLHPTSTADPAGPSILRILSTGKAMTASQLIFDRNYLDNQAAYGYSYIADIWTGPNSFYKMHDLTMTIPIGNGKTFTGRVQGDNTLRLTNINDVNDVVIFDAPTMVFDPIVNPPIFPTSIQIFSGIKFPVHMDESKDQENSTQLSKLLQEAIIAGLVPTTDILSNQYLESKQGKYYDVNSKLTPPGGTTGPWYDLYSKALHSLGDIYTFAFDEPLWPQVQIGANVFTNQYLGITIGPLQQGASSATSVNMIQREQTGMCTAIVVGSSASLIPTGTVTFSIDGQVLGTVPLINGRAFFEITNIAPGFHNLTASYSGDENYLPSSGTEQVFVKSTLTPPTNLRVTQIKNRFATQTEFVNVITWEAPTTGHPPALYKIYRDVQLTDLIATVQGERLRFEDHNRRKGRSYSYFIVSIDTAGQVSSPAEVVFR